MVQGLLLHFESQTMGYVKFNLKNDNISIKIPGDHKNRDVLYKMLSTDLCQLKHEARASNFL